MKKTRYNIYAVGCYSSDILSFDTLEEAQKEASQWSKKTINKIVVEKVESEIVFEALEGKGLIKYCLAGNYGDGMYFTTREEAIKEVQTHFTKRECEENEYDIFEVKRNDYDIWEAVEDTFEHASQFCTK